ncbi:MAG: rRNA methyltransferase [Flammeovirgaceae bacterium]|nr:MAG: rRNA methyltransferase [Flammeovirgaceae bacterium]
MADAVTLPPEFEVQMQALLGNSYVNYKQSLSQPASTSIRINPHKPVTIQGEPVPWSMYGYYLAERPVFTLDPLLHAGAYYVQEASSMFPEQVIRQTALTEKPLRVLDLCAAPGGKSTHLLSLLHPDSLLIANETIRGRTAILTENIIKWGHANVLVTHNDPQDFGELKGFFDMVVVDAPCSGEGLFRKDENARSEWSLNNVQLCSRRQQRIIDDAWPALKENGILVYSTCTHNRSENEEVIERLIKTREAEPVALNIQKSWNIGVSTGKAIGYRFYPHRVKGEGFFLAAIRKLALQSEIRIKPKSNIAPLKKEERDRISDWLKNHDGFSFFLHNNLIRALPGDRADEIEFLTQHLNVLLAGTAVATAGRDKLVPEHAAALSVHLNTQNFPCIDLSLPQALAYLRKESIPVDSTHTGFALVTYKTIPLGWVNVLANRVNNLYPSAWRIRMKP